ncbi:putative gamma-butyrobetaine dioxygenase [Toxocara canis]|uniref:Putative gamma-butyrobetaine dioxygenase n=1 Tax=Toxocara canis TaxID=6265 RepID=A0A0B2UXL0_TOXCA|nr:putative gamma-butyrobetaine dioxygenase [Toxocara canis]
MRRLLIARYCTLFETKPVLNSFIDHVSKRTVEVRWSDGKYGHFPYVWLRDTSPDSHTHTFSPAMKARNITMRDFDVEVQPQRLALEQGELVINWPDGILSKFSSEWLRIRNPSDEEMRRRRRHVYFEDTRMWNAREIDCRLGRYKFKDVTNDDLVLHDFLWSVCLDGIAILSEGPPDAVDQIGRRIGLIHRTHFGEIFEVSTKTDASNMAYASNKEVPFHTDFTSLNDPPQLQMLHMIQRADEGGLNLFVDGFYVAEQLRIHHRKQFEILNRVKIEYIEQGYDTHEGSDSKLHTFHYNMAARHRVIRTDDNDKVIRIQLGNAMRSWFYECDADQIHDVYRAMKLFTDYCYRPENILRIQLQNGDTVLWANTRLLHARSAFSMSMGKIRRLSGCYFSWDILKSRIRQLRDKLNHPLNQPSA